LFPFLQNLLYTLSIHITHIIWYSRCHSSIYRFSFCDFKLIKWK